MQIHASALKNWRIHAPEGEVGQVRDFLFDDQSWLVRYVVVETGTWLASRRVLVLPRQLWRRAGEFGVLSTDLSRDRIRECPGVDTDQPVSRRYEAAFHHHYAQPHYWGGPLVLAAGMGAAAGPAMVHTLSPAHRAEEQARDAELAEAERSHLRSSRELLGYRVAAADGDAGDVDDLVVDEELWTVVHLVVDTQRWWPGGRVPVSPAHVSEIQYLDRRVRVSLPRDGLREGSPQAPARL